MLRRHHILALLSSCCMLASLDAMAEPADQSTKALDPTKELARAWMRWEEALPHTTGPVADTTGEQCGMGQEGPVWFLAGTYGGEVTRECTIPAGKELFFPLLNRWCVYPVDFFQTKKSIHDVSDDVLAFYEDSRQHTCSLTLRIDGEDLYAGDFEVMDEEMYVLEPNPFEIYLNPEDNFLTPYGMPGGAMQATGDGHYARLKPLPPGDHVLELGGSTCDGDDVWFETSAIYHLHIEE